MMLHEHEKLNASEIVKRTKLSQPTVSHHLKVLCEAGVLLAEKKGKEVHYSLAIKHMSNCCGSFMNFFSKSPQKGNNTH